MTSQNMLLCPRHACMHCIMWHWHVLFSHPSTIVKQNRWLAGIDQWFGKMLITDLQHICTPLPSPAKCRQSVSLKTKGGATRTHGMRCSQRAGGRALAQRSRVKILRLVDSVFMQPSLHSLLRILSIPTRGALYNGCSQYR